MAPDFPDFFPHGLPKTKPLAGEISEMFTGMGAAFASLYSNSWEKATVLANLSRAAALKKQQAPSFISGEKA